MDYKKIHTAITDEQNVQADELGKLPMAAKRLYLAVRAACQSDGDSKNEASQIRENVTFRFDYPYICTLLTERGAIGANIREKLLNVLMEIEYFDGNKALDDQSENFHANYDALAGLCSAALRRDLGTVYAEEDE